MEFSLTKELSIVLAFLFWYYVLVIVKDLRWIWDAVFGTLQESLLGDDACECDFKSKQCLLFKYITNPLPSIGDLILKLQNTSSIWHLQQYHFSRNKPKEVLSLFLIVTHGFFTG